MPTDTHPALPDLGSNLHRIQREREAEQVARNIAAALSAPEIQAAELNAFFMSPAVAVAYVSPDGSFWDANPTFCAMVGYSRRELVPHRTWQSLTHPDDLAFAVEDFDATARGEQPGQTTVRRYLTKQGASVQCSVRVTRVPGRDGELVHLIEQATVLADRRDPARGDRRGATLDLARRHWAALAVVGVLLLLAAGDYVRLAARDATLRERIDYLTRLQLQKGESP